VCHGVFTGRGNEFARLPRRLARAHAPHKNVDKSVAAGLASGVTDA
jgi:hypothetical protein